MSPESGPVFYFTLALAAILGLLVGDHLADAWQHGKLSRRWWIIKSKILQWWNKHTRN